MINVAIFLSGTGSNAINIIKYFSNHQRIKINLIISNNSKSPIIPILVKKAIKYVVFSRKDFINGHVVLNELEKNKISYIVLAGFLLRISSLIIDSFPNRIINVHPSLLPEFGGKGMYGMHVHNSVFKSKKNQTGITIHEVNQDYDKGRIIFQAKCDLLANDSPRNIQRKVQRLEHKFYPTIINNFILSKNEN